MASRRLSHLDRRPNTPIKQPGSPPPSLSMTSPPQSPVRKASEEFSLTTSILSWLAAAMTIALGGFCFCTIVFWAKFFAFLSVGLCYIQSQLKSKSQVEETRQRPERVLLITDTGPTNICGVLRKFHELQHHLREQGCEVETIHTGQFLSFPAPWYSDVELPFPTPYMMYKVSSKIEQFNPDYINIMTEGTLGLVTRVHCCAAGRKFTTMWCTRFDLYMDEVMAVAASLTRKYLSWFHGESSMVITPSPSMGRELVKEKFVSPEVCHPIMNGCNTDAFSHEGLLCKEMETLPRPIWLYVGRVSHEKNVLSFLDMHKDLEGSMAIVGKGPYFNDGLKKYGSDRVKFLGWKKGDDLAAAYRTADVFVFPSRTDTFGQVMVEAMACGVPVAAFPVTGPIDVVATDDVGSVDEDLHAACLKAYNNKNSAKCIEYAKTFSWKSMTKTFLEAHRNVLGPNAYSKPGGTSPVGKCKATATLR